MRKNIYSIRHFSYTPRKTNLTVTTKHITLRNWTVVKPVMPNFAIHL